MKSFTPLTRGINEPSSIQAGGDKADYRGRVDGSRHYIRPHFAADWSVGMRPNALHPIHLPEARDTHREHAIRFAARPDDGEINGRYQRRMRALINEIGEYVRPTMLHIPDKWRRGERTEESIGNEKRRRYILLAKDNVPLWGFYANVYFTK